MNAMCFPIRRSQRVLFVSGLLLALSLSAASRAQTIAWDAEHVKMLATELSGVAEKIDDAFRKEPPQPVGSGQARARASFEDQLRKFRTDTRALVSKLEAGGGHDDTLPIAKKLKSEIRDLREEGRRISWKEPLVSLGARANELIDQLRPYYFAAPAPEGTTGTKPR